MGFKIELEEEKGSKINGKPKKESQNLERRKIER